MFSQVSAIATFNIIANILQLCVVLLTTNLYSQDDLGSLLSFLSYNSVFITFLTLGYPMIIPNLKEKEVITFMCGMIYISLIASVIILIFLSIIQYIHSIPLVLYSISSAINTSVQMCCIRYRRYKSYNFGIIFPWISFCITILLCSYCNIKVIKILTYQAIVMMIGTCCYTHYAFRLNFLTLFRTSQIKTSLTILWQYKKQAAYILPANICNALAYNLPVIMLERIGDLLMAAQYGVVVRFLLGPLQILTNAISKVFHGELATLRRNNNISLIIELFIKTRNKLLCIGMLIFLCVLIGSIAAKSSTIIVNQWAHSIQFSQILSPLIAIMTVVAPLSAAYFVFNKQQNLLFNQVSYLLITALSFYVGLHLTNNIIHAIILFSLLSCVRYVIIFYDIKKIFISK